MKLERNRAERRSKRGIPILYNGIPYLILAALAAGFLFGAPQMIAASSIAQASKSTVSVVERTQFQFVLAGYLGKTNSVLSRGFTESDFTFTGSKVWVDDLQGNWRLKFTSSGTFTPKKKVKIDVFLVGGGGGGRNGVGNQGGGGGGAGGYAGTWTSVTLAANQNYTITIGAGGAANGGTGGTTSISGPGISTMSKNGGAGGIDRAHGGNGGSGGAAPGTYTGGSNGSNGGGSSPYYGTGQGSTTREFGEVSGTLYAGAGGGGGQIGSGGAGGAGGGGAGGSAPYSGTASAGVAGTNNYGGGGGGGGSSTTSGAAGAAGGSGICIIRNYR
jgi:hypothetical protein